MKKGLRCGFFFVMILPVGSTLGGDQASSAALNRIISAADDAPALLSLTPAHSNAVWLSPKSDTLDLLKKQKNQSRLSTEAALKPLQAKIKQLTATLNRQQQELKQLRKTTQQGDDAEVAQLKQSLQENLQAIEQMQLEFAATAAVKIDNNQDNSRLQQALDKNQQQSSLLQKQLNALAISNNEKNKENKDLRAELEDSRKKMKTCKIDPD